MATFRVLVHDVDEVLPFYSAIGFEVVDRWGPPFAIVEKGDIELWLSGPGTSAQKPVRGEQPTSGGWNRPVVVVNSVEETIATLVDLGFSPLSDPVAGPGGTQVLFRDPSGNLVEVFEPRA